MNEDDHPIYTFVDMHRLSMRDLNEAIAQHQITVEECKHDIDHVLENCNEQDTKRFLREINVEYKIAGDQLKMLQAESSRRCTSDRCNDENCLGDDEELS